MSGRSRRRNADSSSDSDRGVFTISSSKFRVAAPAALPLPLDTRYDEISRPVAEAFGRRIEDRAYQVLEDYGVDLADEWTDVSIVNRCVPGYPDTHQPTVLITASWTPTSPESWLSIVTCLKKFVDGLTNNSEWRHTQIAIEMIAAELCMDKHLAPVVGNERLEKDWPKISSTVLNLLEAFPQTQSHTTSISLFHLGFDLPAKANPITVYISVDYECYEDTWPPVLTRIQDELNKGPHKLVAFMEHGECEPLAWEFLPPTEDSSWVHAAGRESRLKRPYSTEAQIGADMTASIYLKRDDGKRCSPLLGTLGCYVQVQMQGQAGWKTLALTNYHVVRPAFDGFQVKAVTSSGKPDEKRGKIDAPSLASDLFGYDQKGFGPSNVGRPMEHPSRSRHNYTVSAADNAIRESKSKLQVCPEELKPAMNQKIHDLIRVRDQLVAFFDDKEHHLGKLWAGSGLAARSQDAFGSRRLDWALLEVEASRQGKNLLPDWDFWCSMSSNIPPDIVPLNLCEHPLRQPTAEESLSNFKSGQIAYKIGAFSGATVGSYNGYRSVSFLNHDKHVSREPSFEHNFIVSDDAVGPFACPGDSGAVVINENGRVVGILFSGRAPQQTGRGSHTLVTPIEDVFRHIKQHLSQNKVKDVRIALS